MWGRNNEEEERWERTLDEGKHVLGGSLFLSISQFLACLNLHSLSILG